MRRVFAAFRGIKSPHLLRIPTVCGPSHLRIWLAASTTLLARAPAAPGGHGIHQGQCERHGGRTTVRLRPTRSYTNLRDVTRTGPVWRCGATLVRPADSRVW